MRFGSSSLVMALGLVASAQATYWCYSTEKTCKAQLSDCTLDTATGHYCGNVSKAKAKRAVATTSTTSDVSRRSIWCYSSEALCTSQLDDCTFDSSTSEYCGDVSKTRRSLWCYDSETLCESQLGDCTYMSATGEYCGNIDGTAARRDLSCYATQALCAEEHAECAQRPELGEASWCASADEL